MTVGWAGQRCGESGCQDGESLTPGKQLTSRHTCTCTHARAHTCSYTLTHSHTEVVQLRGAPLLGRAWGAGSVTADPVLIVFSRVLGYLDCLQRAC